jgi:exosortase C (VPDSG-CTERM-specific)
MSERDHLISTDIAKPAVQDALGKRSAAGYSVRQQLRNLAALTAVLFVCFAGPLYALVKFALHSELFSHVLLIPFISAYLVWTNRQSLPTPSKPFRRYALIPFATGLAVLLFWLRAPLVTQDYLTWATLSFVLFFVAACCFCFDPEMLRALSFPLGFLVFGIPFPVFLVDWIETFLQHSSALGADFLFTLTGMTFLRSGLLFQLPGIRLEVAPECSGIHSTLVLFITSLVAGKLFLRKLGNRAVLAAAVIPLGIIRNALRIWTIGELCVHISPDMINSPIHRRGGPLFFLVSLLPLFLLLYFQRRCESRSGSATP